MGLGVGRQALIHETITPSGYSILFEDGAEDPETGKRKRRSYTVNGQKLASVTTVLGCLDKGGLTWAAAKVSVQGAITLARNGELPANLDGAISRLRSRGLWFQEVWNAKADRGTLAHSDLVALMTGGELRELDAMEPEERRMAQGIARWYADMRPVAIEQETMVASLEHGFAGRPDLYCTIPTLHPTARWLCDLKTTEELPRDRYENVKPPYDEMLLQLSGYEIARRESGYEPSDFQAILRVDGTGEIDFWPTVVGSELFLGVLGAWRSLKGLPSKRTVIEPERAAA